MTRSRRDKSGASLLVRGAHSVVATLGPVDDRRSASLFVAFHQHWICGLAAADALRAAQFEALHAGHGPREWAAATAFVR
jgi:CHAT domain-containing protein